MSIHEQWSTSGPWRSYVVGTTSEIFLAVTKVQWSRQGGNLTSRRTPSPAQSWGESVPGWLQLSSDGKGDAQDFPGLTMAQLKIFGIWMIWMIYDLQVKFQAVQDFEIFWDSSLKKAETLDVHKHPARKPKATTHPKFHAAVKRFSAAGTSSRSTKAWDRNIRCPQAPCQKAKGNDASQVHRQVQIHKEGLLTVSSCGLCGVNLISPKGTNVGLDTAGARRHQQQHGFSPVSCHCPPFQSGTFFTLRILLQPCVRWPLSDNNVYETMAGQRWGSKRRRTDALILEPRLPRQLPGQKMEKPSWKNLPRQVVAGWIWAGEKSKRRWTILETAKLTFSDSLPLSFNIFVG